jgi:hypothetical protein
LSHPNDAAEPHASATFEEPSFAEWSVAPNTIKRESKLKTERLLWNDLLLGKETNSWYFLKPQSHVTESSMRISLAKFGQEYFNVIRELDPNPPTHENTHQITSFCESTKADDGVVDNRFTEAILSDVIRETLTNELPVSSDRIERISGIRV